MAIEFIKLLNEPEIHDPAVRGMALWRLGFRPFFLLAGLFAAMLVLWLTLALMGSVDAPPSAFGLIDWHRHEMLFGFTMAVITGFLFTAVPNWTGLKTPSGPLLAAIAMLWVSGRIAVAVSAHFPYIALGIDVIFPVMVALGIAPALFAKNNRRNYFFLALLTLVSSANVWFHLAALDIVAGGTDRPILSMLGIVVVMITVMGGRVIPFFTERGLALVVKRDARAERPVLVLTALSMLAWIVFPDGAFSAILCGMAALAHGWRIWGWCSRSTCKEPLLWILHAGYGWLIAGLALKAFSGFIDIIPRTLAVHTLTVGAIGSLTLGFMARVSLGHTGRLLKVGKPMVLSFVALQFAVIARVIGPLLMPELAHVWYALSGSLWMAAFVIFTAIYAPILCEARPDGKMG